MRLIEYINILKGHDPKLKLRKGLGAPDSWRGVYAELAFPVVEDITIGEMIAHAESAIGTTYRGYKGGNFEMDEDTPIHIDDWGEWTDGGAMWELLLELMVS